jgi:hypothetical protein
MLESIRSPESIRNKIRKIIDSFNIAHQQMIGTGAGTVGLEHDKFQDYIVDDVCRYYFELLPLMKDRPNVMPWFTNHGTEKDESTSEELSSDEEESIVELEDNSSSNNTKEDDVEIEVTKVTNDSSGSGASTRRSSYDSTLDLFHSNNSTHDENDSSSDNSVMKTSKNSRGNKSVNNSTIANKNGSKKAVSINSSASSTTKGKNKKLSPLNAKQLKKNLFKERNNQINNKKRRGKTNITPENDEHEFFVEQRNIKMKFELEKHNDLKIQHDEKMELEKKKYKMHEQEMSIRLDNEKNKRILSKVEIFKARLEFKKQDPTISDEFLDLHFPLT